MAANSPSCAVAFPSERNNATSENSATGNATPIEPNARKPASIQELRAQLRAQLERNHEDHEADEAEAELRAAQLATETRRQCVLGMLAERPKARYAALVDDPDADPVLLTVAIRDAFTFDLCVPREKFDPFLLLDLIDRHNGRVH